LVSSTPFFGQGFSEDLPHHTRNVHFRRAAGEQDAANAQEEDQDTQGLSAVALDVEGFLRG
jgi:hypothetical protein